MRAPLSWSTLRQSLYKHTSFYLPIDRMTFSDEESASINTLELTKRREGSKSDSDVVLLHFSGTEIDVSVDTSDLSSESISRISPISGSKKVRPISNFLIQAHSNTANKGKKKRASVGYALRQPQRRDSGRNARNSEPTSSAV